MVSSYQFFQTFDALSVLKNAVCALWSLLRALAIVLGLAVALAATFAVVVAFWLLSSGADRGPRHCGRFRLADLPTNGGALMATITTEQRIADLLAWATEEEIALPLPAATIIALEDAGAIMESGPVL